MHLAFISPSFYPAFYYGGPIFSTYYNALSLSRLGVAVYVSTADSNGAEKLDVETNKYIKHKENFFIKYYSPSSARGFSYRMLSGLWRDIKSADIVYTQSLFSLSSVIALWYSAIHKKRVLLSPRGQLGSWSIKSGSRFKRLWLRFFIKPFSGSVRWHVTAGQEKSDVLSVFPKAEIIVIANGIDLDKYGNISKAKLRSYYSKYTGGKIFSKVVVSMGRLHKVKGFDILINAFKKVSEVFPDAGLLIAGEDYGERVHLEKLAEQCGLKNNIFFTGLINDEEEKIKFLMNADVFALASHNENFGIVYAEALAAGTPVVASKGTPWSEVEKFNCGKWVNNSEHEFSEAMIKLLGSANTEMGANGIKLIKENYSWDAISEKFKMLFEEMLQEKINV